MKKIIALFIVFILLLSSTVTGFAADGKVIYDGNARKFIFEPGSNYSPADLFDNFKGVMPGDILTQKITVKNDADNKVKVKIYMRSLGAHEDSAEFLSKLGLKVQPSAENKMAYMFDAAAGETAQLTDWVCLGTLYSGGEVNLDVVLNIPVELDNNYQNRIGYLDWEFMTQEFPVEDTDPKPPQTGDNSNLGLWITLMVCSAAMSVVLISRRTKEQKNRQGTAVQD